MRFGVYFDKIYKTHKYVYVFDKYNYVCSLSY